MTANALSLSWSASTSGTTPISYQPLYRVSQASTWIPFGPLITTPPLTVTVTGLSASTSYDFEIVASNSAGTSPASAIVSAATDSGNPFPAAGNVAGSQSTGSQVPVIVGPQNGAAQVLNALAVTGITVTDAGATTVTTLVTCTSGKVAMTLGGSAVTGSGTASITLTDTFANVKTALGTLVYTAPTAATTDTVSIKLTDQLSNTNTLLIPILVSIASPGVAPSAPVVTASAATTTTMQLDWPASTGTAPITYQVQFKLPAASTYTPSGGAISALTAIVTGLSAAVSYNFQVLAINSFGTTPSAVVTASTTANVAPTAPTNLQITASTATTMTVTWSAPATGSAPIDYQPLFRLTSAASGTRLYYNQPGTNNNVWNTPIGDGATFGNSGDADTIAARHGGIINAWTNFGAVMWVSTSANDPQLTFVGQGRGDYEVAGQYHGVETPSGNIVAHIVNHSYAAQPYGFNPDGSGKGDCPYCFVDHTGHPGIYWDFGPLNNASDLTSSSGTQNSRFWGSEDATSDTFAQDWETQHANNCLAAGVLRGYDMDPAQNPARMPSPDNGLTAIQHVLRYAHDARYLKSNLKTAADGNPDFGVGGGTLYPNSWPQLYQDFQNGINVYSGNLLYGTQLFIPMSTPRPAGLTNAGKQLFWTLQRYGSITRDQAGGGYVLYATQDVPTAWLTQANTDMPTLVQLLVPMRNQHQGGQSFTTNPMNGPGNRLDVGPPALTSATLPNAFAPFGGLLRNTTTVVITGLTASTSYDIEITASNSLGSATSAAVTGSTGIPGIPTDATGTQARPAQDLLNRVGINTHFAAGLYSAFTPAQAVTAIQTIGCTLVRDTDNG